MRKVVFDVGRDSLKASTPQDEESAYMRGLFRHLFLFAGSTTMKVVYARIIIAHRLDKKQECILLQRLLKTDRKEN